MINKFKEYLEEESLSDNTVNSYVRDVKLFIELFKEKYDEDIEKIDHMIVVEYIKELKSKELSATSINRKISAIKKYNDFLIEIGLQEENVVKKKDYIKLQPTLSAPISPTEKEVFKIKLNAKGNKRDLAIITLLAHSGIRVSELTNIKISEVNFDSKMIIINGKGNKTRIVVMADVVYDTLKDYLEERREQNTLDKNKYLFIGRQKIEENKPLSRRTINSMLDNYAKISKIQIHPHLLRNYFCTEATNKNALTIQQIASLAGHYSLNTTKKYIKLNQKDLLKGVNAI